MSKRRFSGPIDGWTDAPSRQHTHWCLKLFQGDGNDHAPSGMHWRTDVGYETSKEHTSGHCLANMSDCGLNSGRYSSRRSLTPWTPDGQYSTASAYGAYFHGQTYMPGGKELWKVRAPLKCRFFWLAMYRRCWTSERRFRHGLQTDATSALCNQADETIDHPLLGCVYSRECWFKILRQSGHQVLIPDTSSTLVDWWLSSRKRVAKALRKGFDTFVMLLAWHLWKERNARAFNAKIRQPGHLLQHIKEEANMWITAGHKQLSRWCPNG